VAAYIDAPPERVWMLVSDIHLMPRLSTELQEVEWLDGTTQPAVGCRFRGRNAHSALGSWETVSTIVTCDAPREFGWVVGDPGEPAASWRFTLRPEGPGTVLEQRARMGPGRSGLNLAIDARPENEQKIVFVRLREWEAGLTANLAAIRELAEEAP